MKSEWGHSAGTRRHETQSQSQNQPQPPSQGHAGDYGQRSQTPTHSHAGFSPASLSIKLESLGSPGFAGFAYTDPHHAHNEPSPAHHPLSPLQQLSGAGQASFQSQMYTRDDGHTPTNYPALSPDHDLRAMAQTQTQRLSSALSPAGPGSVPSDYGDYGQEHFLLDQFGPSMYDQAPGHSQGHHSHGPSPAQSHGHNQGHGHDHSLSHSRGGSHAQPEPDFNLDSMEFIAPQNLGQESRAFPPSELPENTPALGPADVRNRVPQQKSRPPSPMVFQSPVLPSQNSKSYNQEHLIQKQRQRSRLSTPMMAQQKSTYSSSSKQGQSTSSNPSFTPLASPAVTPLESQVNSNKRQVFPPAQTDFEPLTSPALKAQQQQSSSYSSSGSSNAMDLDRRRSSTTYAGDDYSHGSTAKRRTPHSTPNLSAATSKLKRSPSLRKVPQHIESANDATTSDSSKLRSSESTPMLPPQGKKTVIDSSSVSLAPNSSPAASFGPGTLMGFTMNRLAEQQGSHPSRPSPSESPSNTPQPGEPALQRTISGSGSTSAHNSLADRHTQGLTSSSETSPMLEAMNGDFSNQGDHVSGRRDRIPGKKTSHKIAEQGRRNRMNQAVHELTRLIPENLQEGITVPSKATTIELAGVYIRKLLHEIDSLKNGNHQEDQM